MTEDAMTEEKKNTGQEDLQKENPDTKDTEETAQKAGKEKAAEQTGKTAEDQSQGAGNAEQKESAEDKSAENEPGRDDGSAKTGKSFFGRKKEDKEKQALQQKVDDLQDRLRRQMAEFDNYRKRTDKEKEQMFSMGERNVIEKMLPIIDNFERGFDTVSDEEKDDAFVTGMKKIYSQMVKQLTDMGVKPIEAVGKEFDPNYHNAVMQVDSDQYDSGVVAQELQKGYLYHDSVIRHSMVAVTK